LFADQAEIVEERARKGYADQKEYYVHYTDCEYGGYLVDSLALDLASQPSCNSVFRPADNRRLDEWVTEDRIEGTYDEEPDAGYDVC
jgi:hypothetical protein